MPLGIYNVSITRVCQKLENFCRRLEDYIKAASRLDDLRNLDALRRELIDYIELSIYAAAEHVDDIDFIVKGLYRDENQCKRRPAYKLLVKEIKTHKRFISAAANAIKHDQARIRLFSSEFRQGAIAGCLHGFFVESVVNGEVRPSVILQPGNEIFSITTLAWEILIFLLSASSSLGRFILAEVSALPGPVNVQLDVFYKAVVAAARLPLYTFGESHPMSKATVVLVTNNGDDDGLNSAIYGSIKRPWLSEPAPIFGRNKCEYEGDGTSRQFRTAFPTNVGFVHWGQ